MKVRIIVEETAPLLEDQVNEFLDELEKDEMHLIYIQLLDSWDHYTAMVLYRDRAVRDHFGPQPGG